MAEQESTAIDELAKVNIPTTTTAWINYIKKECDEALKRLAQQNRKFKTFSDVADEPGKTQYQRVQVLLNKMTDYLQMTPEINEKTRIANTLRVLVLDEGQFHFPKDVIKSATLLIEGWEADNFGANEVREDEAEEEDDGEGEDESGANGEPPPKRRRKSKATENGPTGVLIPPTEHPIFGIKGGKRGIMYGAARKKGARRLTWVENPALISQKRSGKAYGSNGLDVGTWFPYQSVALFNGAHNSMQGGIAGNTTTGAYSIVVSGHYDDLDKDHGDVLFYSGSKSHDNTDPQSPAPSSQGTQALQASLVSGKPVRVLRAASGKSVFAPSAGLRYDGLYHVVSEHRPKNRKGGLYEQYKLVREAGQPPIDLNRPSPRERADLEKVALGYA